MAKYFITGGAGFIGSAFVRLVLEQEPDAEIINFDALVQHGMINAPDVDLMRRTDSVDEAYDWIILQLAEQALGEPGPTL